MGSNDDEAGSAPSAPPAADVLPQEEEQQQQQQQSSKMAQLEEVLSRYEITIAEANELVALVDYRVVVVADDSGSMNQCAVPVHERRLGAVNATRWHELRDTLSTAIEIITCVVPGGIDLHFLNRPPTLGLTSVTDGRLAEAFAAPPSGSTPLTETVKSIVASISEHPEAAEKPVLLMIATDGEPNGGPASFKRLLRSVIARKVTPVTFRFQILACTDDDESVAWLEEVDEEFTEVDVTDDYATEKRQILAAGKVKHFRRSDWVVKALLGPIVQRFDALDESSRRVKKGGGADTFLRVAFFFLFMAVLAHIMGLGSR